MELEYKIIVAMAKEIGALRKNNDLEWGEFCGNEDYYDPKKIIEEFKEEVENKINQENKIGDWDYEVENEIQLKKIIATYFINKYNMNENKTIDKVEKIFENLK